MSKLGVELHEKFAIFRLWAPFAKDVALIGTFSNWEEIAMTRSAKNSEYWEVKVAKVAPGQNYKFVITTESGEKVQRNDPRALALTDSDQGASVVTSDDFDWDDDDFLPPAKTEQIIYEMHIGTFNRPDPATNGTFETAIAKLDYLKDLGVTTIELMPITAMISSNGWGYAPNSIYAVEPLYGGMFGLKNFVKECHARGLGVILDVVYNHFSENSGLWEFDGWNGNGHGGIYFYGDERGETPWGARPDFGRQEVREFILDSVALWLNNYHVDGLRIDSTIYMRNTAGQNDDPPHDIADAWNLMQEITALAKKINPHALIIAEDCGLNHFLTKNSQNGGAGFDAQWDLGLPHVIRGALNIGSENSGLQNLVDVISQDFNGDFFQKIIFADSHDTAANGGARLFSVIENSPHDSTSRATAILSSALALTAPGIPMLLAGAEFLGGTDFNDWQSLSWDNLVKFRGVFLAHQHLINLRKNLYGDSGGLLENRLEILHFDAKNRVLAFQRGELARQPVIILANFSDQKFEKYRFNLPDGVWISRFNSSWRGYETDISETNFCEISRDQEIILPPFAVLILTQKK